MHTSRISTHVYYFPFSWRKESIKRNFQFKQHKQMADGEVGKIAAWQMREHHIIEDKHYNELVYFYKPVQALLYEQKQGCIVKVYEKEKRQSEDVLIVVVDGRQYTLRIADLTLKFYKSGIGILSLEVVNDKYKEPEEIIGINGLGKCVYPYILPIEHAQKDYFPERIIFKLGDETIVENFDKQYKQSPMIVADFIMALLGPDFYCEGQMRGSARFAIEPLFSNRMFTLCLYKNQQLLENIKNKTVKEHFLRQFMVFSRKEKVFDVHYIELPKVLYGIGRFALIGITADEKESKLYNELTTLAIVQRASLLHFSNQIAFITTLPKEQVVSGIGNLYEIYMQFVNQMYFHEVTVDVQGSCIYEGLLKQLRIKEEMQDLVFEMREVHEYTSFIQKNQSQSRMDMLAVVGTLLVIPTFVTGFFGMNILEEGFIRWWERKDILLFINSYVILPVFAILGVYSWWVKGHRYEKVWRLMLAIAMIGSLVVLLTQGCGLSK